MIFRQTIQSAITCTIIVFSALAILGAPRALAQETGDLKAASEMSISEIMKEAHKKPEGSNASLLKRVASGEASTADKERLLDLYKSMAQQQPPKGGAEDWKERTDLLVTATEAVVQGKEGASSQLKKASNCLKCHKVHKGD